MNDICIMKDIDFSQYECHLYEWLLIFGAHEYYENITKRLLQTYFFQNAWNRYILTSCKNNPFQILCHRKIGFGRLKTLVIEFLSDFQDAWNLGNAFLQKEFLFNSYSDKDAWAPTTGWTCCPNVYFR